ncbi:2,3-bisphosphoglycerate-dependent phosphoglycerate mutase [Herbaspirillum camelliae]|uniref:2,3-bisphosphoglycerate-dependent phosphoglycerate mutase n=1 Tax=Herbaspirillum camelliae TaxID=1892903 RepID=UPI000949D456|nr:2,3-bisphosphoglycerate-dependent phosphoglycerate mutase [Herbaspirillum camelliae]
MSNTHIEPTSTANLVLIRHGESLWNQEQRFTGWADVPLTQAGIEQVADAAASIRREGLRFDLAYSSVLGRCTHSLRLLLEASAFPSPDVQLDWRLNERHYGALTGMRKAEAVSRFGEDVVKRWRRSYEGIPPPVDATAARFIPIDARYSGIEEERIPTSESLEQTVSRVSAFWNDEAVPALLAGKQILIMSHGNALRALTSLIENLGQEEIVELEISNCSPVAYRLCDSLHVDWKKSLDVEGRSKSEIL